MSHGTFPISVLLVCSLSQAIQAGYEGRPQTMVEEASLVGIVRAVPIRNLVPTITTGCCPCRAPKRIYPARYIVINRNPVPSPSLNLPTFHGSYSHFRLQLHTVYFLTGMIWNIHFNYSHLSQTNTRAHTCMCVNVDHIFLYSNLKSLIVITVVMHLQFFIGAIFWSIFHGVIQFHEFKPQ